MGDALPALSDHSPLMLSLALPSPPALAAPVVPTLCARWEPGASIRWQAYLNSLQFLAWL